MNVSIWRVGRVVVDLDRRLAMCGFVFLAKIIVCCELNYEASSWALIDCAEKRCTESSFSLIQDID